MNPRERTLLTVFFGILFVGGTVAVFYFGFFQDYVKTLADISAEETKKRDKTKELNDLQDEEKRVLELSPRLQDYKKISLPDMPHKEGAKARNLQEVLD